VVTPHCNFRGHDICVPIFVGIRGGSPFWKFCYLSTERGRELTPILFLVNTVPSSITTTKRQVTIDVTSTIRAPTGTGANGGNGNIGGGLSLSDKIALGIGIGIGLPAAIAGLVSCCIMMARGG
jgi:hypothetical protein